MYHQVERSEILRSTCRVHLCVLYGSEKKINISVYRERRIDFGEGGSVRGTRIEGYRTVPACPSDKVRLEA
jgi:hypothetical protein